MTNEAKQVLAFIFKRSGKETLPASDVYLAISMELQWCSPKEAKAFVRQAADAGFLKERDHGVTPSFEIDTVSIPTGFSPSEKCFAEVSSAKADSAEKDIISLVISRVKEKTKMTGEEVENNIEQLSKEKMIVKDVAAVFFAKKHNCKIQDLIPALKENVFTSEKNTT
ncbi:MAG: DUF2240 family protein [Candidatus Thermoplasmatota archaeon]|nr:DUF2240 family protein [Candidatus Thermoplasmatota archaeon]